MYYTQYANHNLKKIDLYQKNNLTKILNQISIICSYNNRYQYTSGILLDHLSCQY